MSNKYFFIFSLGPVQSFIAQAKKMQDLYLGCQMISDYCRHAAMKFEQQGGEVIFPQWRSKSLTNRFMGVIEIADEDQGKKIGKTIEDAVKKRFVAEGLMAISAGLAGYNASEIIGVKDQLENHLETYWIFSPYDKDNYATDYKRAEQVFGMSKFMRTPKQLIYQSELNHYKAFNNGEFLGETGRKCIVDGEKNVKVYRWSNEDNELDHTNSAERLLKYKLFLEERAEVLLIGTEENKDGGPFVSIEDVPPKFIQDGEGLSAISFFKRCYKPDMHQVEKESLTWDELKQALTDKDDYGKNTFLKSKYTLTKTKNGRRYFLGVEFPTTARIAVIDVIHKVKENHPEIKEAKTLFYILESLINEARKEDFHVQFPNYRPEDEELFFEENLTSKYFEKHGFNNKKRLQILTIQQQFSKSLPRKDGLNVSIQPYYALVSFDIDSLGRTLREVQSKEEHSTLATKLGNFAQNVIEIVEGRIPNEEGDTSNLGHILHAGGDDFLFAINLRNLFSTLDEIQKKLNANSSRLTYSTSIVIAHYKSPLARAVKTVKAELNKVKDRYENEGKNGIAFNYMMKSGAVTTTYFKQDKLSLLNSLFDALQAEELSPKFIFQFAKNMEEMGFDGEMRQEEQEQVRKFTLWELQRLMQRASENNKKFKKEDKLSDFLKEQVIISEGKERFDLQNVLQFFKIAELTAKHTNQWKWKKDI